MGDEPTTPSGWLPPRAPGAGPAPRFEPVPPRREPVPAAPAPVEPGRPPVRTGAPERNALAATGLGLGIAGLTMLVLTFGLAFPLALPCSAAAWACASRARTRIDLGDTNAGRGQAQAAIVLGILGVVLAALAAVGWIIALSSGVDLDELREDLERQSDPQVREALAQTARALLGR